MEAIDRHVINREALKSLFREMLPEMIPDIRRALAEIAPPTPEEKRFLTAEEVSHLTGWHVNTVYRLVKEGQLRKVPNLGREVKFAPETIDALMANGLRRQANVEHNIVGGERREG